ncbi:MULTISPECIES: alpha/beta fold hydrolase [unclassified Salinibacterium]|uniref:alpha/beta fold hydrolase n=1 Tax=unclassified Salinibacterium TaxID=2632331 RepID=UPI00143CD120|nr:MULTISPECIES: alpha/beta fold hydrolase [unclassified Salinibacterium]
MAVLLLHGLGTSAAHLLDQLGPALPGGAEVIAPDIRAHGESTLIGDAADFSFAALTAEVADAVRASAASGALSIVGVSMGAALGLRLALAGEFEIDRLVLIRPSFTDRPLPHNLRAFPVMGELLMRHGATAAEQRFKSSSLYHALTLVTHAGANAALQQFRAPDATARAIRLVEVPRNRAFRDSEELAMLDAPTTIIAAPRDPVHPVSIAEQWQVGIRGSTLTMLPARDDGMAAHLVALRAAVSSALA